MPQDRCLPASARRHSTHPPSPTFLVSQNSAMPMCGSSSFCRSSRAYCTRASRVTPMMLPRLPM